MYSAKDVIKKLQLIPHPKEGGFFIETYRSEDEVSKKCLPSRYNNNKPISTAIYYLLTADTCSAMHRLQTDELFHFYYGDPVEILQLTPEGNGSISKLGMDLKKGMRPQIVVHKNNWQGSRLMKGGKFCLMGTTVSPGFEYVDYEHGNREQLITQYPKFKKRIIELTPLKS